MFNQIYGTLLLIMLICLPQPMFSNGLDNTDKLTNLTENDKIDEDIKDILFIDIEKLESELRNLKNKINSMGNLSDQQKLSSIADKLSLFAKDRILSLKFFYKTILPSVWDYSLDKPSFYYAGADLINQVIRKQIQKDILDKAMLLSSKEGEDFLFQLKNKAQDLLDYEEDFTEEIIYFSCCRAGSVEGYFRDSENITKGIDKIYKLISFLKYDCLLDLKSPDPEKEDREVKERAAYDKKNRKNIARRERERLERNSRRDNLNKNSKKRPNVEKNGEDDKDGIVEAVGSKLSIREKVLKASAVVDYYNKFLAKLSDCTAADFHQENKVSIIESVNKLNFLCRNPFISDELQLKTFEEYKRLMIDLIKEGRITNIRNGFIFPASVAPFSIIPQIAFLKISEEDEILELFDVVSGYKNEILLRIEIETPLEKKSSQEIEQIYDVLKEYKYQFKTSEVVLEKLKQFRKDIFSAEVLKEFEFENPFWEGIRKFKCHYNDQYKKLNSNASFQGYAYFAVLSIVRAPFDALQLAELLFSKLWPIK